MTIPEKRLSPAPSADVEAALAHALRYDGKKAFRLSGESMGKITAAHLVRCLEQAGFVVMKGPPAALPTTCAYAESAARVIARTEKAGERGGWLCRDTVSVSIIPTAQKADSQ